MQQQTNRYGTNTVSRGMHLTLFLTAMAWAAAANIISSRAAEGIAARFQLGLLTSLLENLFFLFLVVVGFRTLDWIATRSLFAKQVLPLPGRAGWLREWGIGAALGWALSLSVALPLLISGNLHGTLLWNSNTLPAMVAAVGSIVVGVLAIEVVFRGYPFRRLIDALGPSWATALISVFVAVLVVQANPPRDSSTAIVDCTLFALLLAVAWLRTHALWLGWGLHFGYRTVTAIILGLPVAGRADFGSPTNMIASGPRWLTGGAFGPDAAVLTALMILVAMAVLYRVTRDLAWTHTFRPIVPAGYEVTVAPPAAHVAMEKAAAPPPLVQILSTTPQTRSVVEPPPKPDPL